MNGKQLYQVIISWHRGLTQVFDRFDVYVDENFVRDFAPAHGREHIYLDAGEHTLHIEASGHQQVKQDLPFEVSGDMEIIIKRELTAVKPHFLLETHAT